MHTRASCDSKSVGLQEAHVVGGHDRHAARGRQRHGARRCSAPRPGGRGAAARCRSDRRTAPARSRARARRRARAPLSSARPMSPSAAPDSAIRPASVLARQPAALEQRRTALLALQIGAGDQAREVAVAALVSGTAASGARAAARSPSSRTSRSTPMMRLHARARAPRDRTSPSRTDCSGRSPRPPACRRPPTASTSSGTRTTLSISEYSVCRRR